MNDVLPGEMARWHAVERAFRQTFELLGFREVRTPFVEPTALFARTVGEQTDIVEKEMYSFEHHADQLTLRPEGTAGAARAYVEHGVHNREPVTRWYYLGPMFRAERPQRGRYRQFWQAGVEVYGDAGPACDAEMIDAVVSFLGAIGVSDVRVHINSIGSGDTRARYRDALVEALGPLRDTLSPESQRRLDTNPLRILDSKHPADKAAIAAVPPLAEFLGEDDRAHFEALRGHLAALGTPHVVDPTLVRGLDYYTRTLFEVRAASEILGAGDTVVGGGRYDAMVESLGGPSVPAIGFAAGVERLILASALTADDRRAAVSVLPLADAQVGHALVLARELRARGIGCDVDGRSASLKSKLRRATSLGARAAIVVGDREVAEGVVELKDLDARTQERTARADAVEKVCALLATPPPATKEPQ